MKPRIRAARNVMMYAILNEFDLNERAEVDRGLL
jgi:hypothetical protein